MRPGFWGILKSVLSAFLGVQSDAVRKQDFENGQPWWAYLMVGVALALILATVLIFLAKAIVTLG